MEPSSSLGNLLIGNGLCFPPPGDRNMGCSKEVPLKKSRGSILNLSDDRPLLERAGTRNRPALKSPFWRFQISTRDKFFFIGGLFVFVGLVLYGIDSAHQAHKEAVEAKEARLRAERELERSKALQKAKEAELEAARINEWTRQTAVRTINVPVEPKPLKPGMDFDFNPPLTGHLIENYLFYPPQTADVPQLPSGYVYHYYEFRHYLHSIKVLENGLLCSFSVIWPQRGQRGRTIYRLVPAKNIREDYYGRFLRLSKVEVVRGKIYMWEGGNALIEFYPGETVMYNALYEGRLWPFTRNFDFEVAKGANRVRTRFSLTPR